MSQPLAWERGTARVLHDGRPVGAAFLIPGRLMLTCSHVVAAVAGIPDDQPLPADFPVTVDFPLLPGCPRASATVHVSVPVAADNSGDVAVLRLSDPPPESAVPLRILESDQLAGHRWRAFGFPRYAGPGGSKDAGIWTTGTIEGREGTGWWQLTCDEHAGFPLAGGFSGAPVWDEEFQGVVGVVVAVEGDQRRRTGYALTVESLAREWPELRVRLLADSPFRELLAFTEQDEAVFHGRGHETRRLLELLGEQQVPVLPVLGASGVGKSSLVSAGLLAGLDDQAYVIARVPHGLRLTAEELLAWALASAGDADPDTAQWHDRWTALARQLASGEDGLRTALEQTLARHGRHAKLLLVVDQFETLLADAPETARKLDAMLGVLTARRTDGSRPAQAVVVARIDFLSQIEQLPVLRAAWEATHVVVPPMTRDQLHAAIILPLEAHGGVRYADGLVEQLLRDTPLGAAALPMLEFTLSQLWEQQTRGILTAASYQGLGGVQGALVGNAESTLWEWADESERAALERIFIQLVRPAEELDAGDRGPDTRRVADRTQFSDQDWSLIHRLASTRLVVVTRRPNGPDTVELAHQTLVESWPRLQRWVEANRAFRSWQEKLRRALRAWQEQGRPDELLLGRREVDEARRWIDERPDEVPAEEVEFVSTSARAQARLARRRRFVRGGFALLAVLVLIASGLALVNARAGDEQRDLAASRQLIARSASLATADPAMAANLALAAQRIHPTADTRARLLSAASSPLISTLVGHTGPVRSVVFSPDGKSLATGSADEAVRLWDVSRRREVSTLPGRNLDVVAFSPDGRNLATFDYARQGVRLWDGRTLDPVGDLTGAAGPLVFSPDGRILATGGVGDAQGSVQLWDVESRRQLATLAGVHGSWPISAAFSPDGTTLAVGGGADQEVRLWDVRTHGQLAVLTGHTGQVLAVVFSPDGTVLASTGGDATVRLWDVRSRTELATLTGHRGAVRAVAFSPDGQTLATAGQDWTVRLWDAPARRALVTLNGHTREVNSVAFSPDGSALASAGEDSTVRLWDMRVGRPLAVFAGQGGAMRPVAFSPDGRTLATGGRDPSARLWDVRTHRQLAVLTGREGMLLTLAFSPDGRTLATASDDGTATLWDTATDREVATLTGHTGLVGALAFSPDGRTLATGSYVDGTVRLWDVSSHRLLTILRGTSSPVVFSPDGSTLATGGGLTAPTVKLWDVRHPDQPAVLSGHTGLVGSAAFSPDGALLATGSWDGTVRLWNVRTRTQEAALTGHTGSTQSVAFSPDGNTLASGGWDATVRLWDVRTRTQKAALTGHADIVWNVAFSPDGNTLASSSQDSTVRLWNIQTRSQVALLTGHTGNVSSGLFSPDGALLATNGGDSTVRLWDTGMYTDLDAVVSRLCTTAGRSMTREEWRQYVPADVSYRQTCP
ncbi:trypsin-like peptidase domain-containing protein [Kitasatospora sp. NPDC087314]|uniref:nSTAND1 domain-containing NTPase n=1 Tax=Kitasatospora sp. NPDC087314 TaxID=3364068 RepID=UPI0038088644